LHIVSYTVQAKEKRQAKEAQLAKAQMDAARRGGVSWGMAEEAALEEDLDGVTEGAMLSITTLQHLPNVKTCFYCPQTFMSLAFQCRDDISKQNRQSGFEKRCLASQS
jgi:hypothetical protein